jgi:hypothetical protein
MRDQTRTPMPQTLINALAAMAQTLCDAEVDSDAVIAQCRVIAARAIAARERQPQGERTLKADGLQDTVPPVTVDFPGRMEPPTSDKHTVEVDVNHHLLFHDWDACRDHLASMPHGDFAAWLERQVWVQYPIGMPMSDILAEMIDRLRRIPEEP